MLRGGTDDESITKSWKLVCLGGGFVCVLSTSHSKKQNSLYEKFILLKIKKKKIKEQKYGHLELSWQLFPRVFSTFFDNFQALSNINKYNSVSAPMINDQLIL